MNRLKKSERFASSFHAIRRALHSAVPSIEGLDVELDEKRGTLDIVIQQDGAPFSSRVISEGTLRVLALCAIAANPWPARLVAFEEPENGVHPRRAETVADLLISMAGSQRQVIVTTHSPTLIAAIVRRQTERIPPDKILLLQCVQEGRSTRVQPFDPREPLFHDAEIAKALKSPGDEGVLEEALLRGWLDG